MAPTIEGDKSMESKDETLDYSKWLTQNTELEIELDIDELEERIAPGMRLSNHNETLVAD